MATIVDVARLAGVSVATVSRVLNESGYADPGTRERVLRAAEELQYKRNIHWSRLKSKSARTILFLLSNRDGLNPMQIRVLMAAERHFRANRYDMIFARHEYAPTTRAADLHLPSVLEHTGAVDGVLLAGIHYPALPQLLDSRKMPYTMLGNDFMGPASHLTHNCVIYDDGGAVAEATAYLHRLGHRAIAFIGNRSQRWFERRYQGYRAAMEERGLTPFGVFDNWGVPSHDYGQLAAAQLLKDQVTAIVAGNDELAAGVWKELTRREIAIPQQVSLLGVGDRFEYSVLEPSLTSISVFADQLGERLSQMLLNRIAQSNDSMPSEVYPCKLMERASCGVCAAERPLTLVKRSHS